MGIVTFYPLLGGALFWISLVLAIILFSNYKKLYPVFYMVSIALYVFTVGFAIDVFDMAKTGILALLIFSAVLFMLLGNYFTRIMHK